MRGVTGVHDGLMRPRREVPVPPPSTLENMDGNCLKIDATSTVVALTIYKMASLGRFAKKNDVAIAKAIN